MKIGILYQGSPYNIFNIILITYTLLKIDCITRAIQGISHILKLPNLKTEKLVFILMFITFYPTSDLTFLAALSKT